MKEKTISATEGYTCLDVDTIQNAILSIDQSYQQRSTLDHEIPSSFNSS